MEDCIFCKIAKKEAPAKVEYEDENFIVFHDIHPKAPLHLLVVSKKHIPSLNDVGMEDKELLGEFLLVAQRIAREKNLKGWRVQINVGREGGQVIDHLHMHLLANQP